MRHATCNMRSLRHVSIIATYFFNLADHLPRLIEMNREDILKAKERFGDATRKPTSSAPTPESYEGLTTQQRKLKKAQNFGVKLVPSSLPPAPSRQVRRLLSHETTAPPSSQSHEQPSNREEDSTGTGVTDRESGADHHRMVSQAASGELLQVNGEDESSSRSRMYSSSSLDRPGASRRKLRQNVISGVLNNEQDSRSKELKGAAVGDLPPKSPQHPRPVASPRRKKVSTEAMVETTLTEERAGENSAPHFKLPVGGVKLLPDGAAFKTKMEQAMMSPKRPVPKPRRSPNTSPKHQVHVPPPQGPPPELSTSPLTPQGALSPDMPISPEDQFRPPPPSRPPPGPMTYPNLQSSPPNLARRSLSETAAISASNGSLNSDSEEYVIMHSSPNKSQNGTIRRPLISNEEGEISLDFGGSRHQLQENNNRRDSHSIPLSRQHRERLQSNPDLTGVPLMSQNLVKLKILANSAGDLIDEQDVRNTEAITNGRRRSSNASTNSAGLASPIGLYFEPPQVLVYKNSTTLLIVDVV